MTREEYQDIYMEIHTNPKLKRDPEIRPYYCLLKYMFHVPLTLDEIGILLGLETSETLSRERVRQLLTRVMHKVQRKYTWTNADGLSKRYKFAETLVNTPETSPPPPPILVKQEPEYHPLYSKLKVVGKTRHGKPLYQDVNTLRYHKPDGEPYAENYKPTKGFILYES